MRIVRRIVQSLAASALLAATLALAGCGYATPPPPPPIAGDADRPHLLSDLSTLSSEPVSPLKTEVPKRGDAILHPAGDPNAPVIYQAMPGLVRHVGDDRTPIEEKLLNEKAAKFANFTQVLLTRLSGQVALAEKTEEVSRLRVSTDVKAVLITAIMDKNGKLTELIVEQHSGKGAIDKMMIDACKKAIWYQNPPVEALSGDGTYKLTIEGRLENYASLDEKHFSFITHLGMGVD